MLSIPLTNEGWTNVDEEDYDFLMQWNWQAYYKNNKLTMIYRCEYINNERVTILMHKVIGERIGLNNSSKLDHIDKDSSNNTRSNLREATNSQNIANRFKPITNKSGYKGVCFDITNQVWKMGITKDGIRINKSYKTAKEAAGAYDFYALFLYKEFAVLNFPELKEFYQSLIDDVLKD